MGIYAETTLTIVCRDNKTAKQVLKFIKGLERKNKNDFNYGFHFAKVFKNEIEIRKSSGRLQNLDYQCDTLWEAIKNIKGVMEMNCPYLIEGEGQYFTNEK